MRRTLSRVALALAFWSLPTAGSASWVYEAQGGAFDGDPLHVALTAEGGRAFGVRCDEVELSLIYISNDFSITPDIMRSANDALPRLLVRVDEGEVSRFFGALEAAGNGAAMMVAPIIGENLPAIIEAGSTIDIGVDVAGQVFLEAQFGALDARSALGQVVSECNNPLMEMN
ncbi:MAG: hypothetical protein AAGI03_01465 [Pseudomonadota bacterium]